MIPGVEDFVLRSISTDSLGMITGSTETVFSGMSDEETVYNQAGGTLNVVGRGTIFSSDTGILPEEGDEVVIDGSTFVVAKKFRAKVMGSFHHWEIVYG